MRMRRRKEAGGRLTTCLFESVSCQTFHRLRSLVLPKGPVLSPAVHLSEQTRNIKRAFRVSGGRRTPLSGFYLGGPASVCVTSGFLTDGGDEGSELGVDV